MDAMSGSRQLAPRDSNRFCSLRVEVLKMVETRLPFCYYCDAMQSTYIILFMTSCLARLDLGGIFGTGHECELLCLIRNAHDTGLETYHQRLQVG